MTASTHLDAFASWLLQLGRTSRFTYGVRQGHQVVLTGLQSRRILREADDLPSTWCAEALCMQLTEVIGVRLGIGRERPQGGRLVGIHIGESRHRGTAARATRTRPTATHGETLPLGGAIDLDCHADTLAGMEDPGAAAASTSSRYVSAPRRGSVRNRRGRGPRGPMVLPGPLNPHGRAKPLTPRDEFDELVLTLVAALTARWPVELADVEFATEDLPPPPGEWSDGAGTFSCLIRSHGHTPARVVVFRRPVELRAKTRLERLALVNEVLFEHVADLLGRDPQDL